MSDFDRIQAVLEIIELLAAIVSTSILGIVMRRRIRRALGKKEEEIDLTSLRTWMAVEEVEKNQQPTPGKTK